MNELTRKKRFVHFDEQVRTGELRMRITEQSKATIELIKLKLYYLFFK